MASFIPSFRDFISPNVTPETPAKRDNSPLDAQSIPVVYGLRRITPPRVFTRVSDLDSNTIVCVYALSMGECLGVYRAFINDTYVQTNTPMAIDETDIPSLSTNRTIVTPIDTSVYAGIAEFEFLAGNERDMYDDYFGSVSRIDGFDSKLLAKHILNPDDIPTYDRDICLFVASFTYEEDVQSPYGDIPTISVDLFGRRVRSSGLVTDTYANRSYSVNPVECLFDYMTNSNYGCSLNVGILDGLTSGSTWDDVRDYCDVTEITTVSDGTQVSNTRYTFNKVLLTSNQKNDNVIEILKTYMFMMPWIDGKFKLFNEGAGSAEVTINEDSLVDSFRITYPDSNTRYNNVIYTYNEPQLGFSQVRRQHPAETSTEYTTYLAEDNGNPRTLGLALPGVTNVYQAERIAKSYLLKTRLQAKYEFVAVKDFFKYRVGDIVNFTTTVPNLTNLKLRIVSMTVQDNDLVAVQAYSHLDSLYTPFPAYISEKPDIVPPVIPGDGGIVQPGEDEIGITPPSPGDGNPDPTPIDPTPIIPDPSPTPTPVPNYTFNLKSGETLPVVGGAFDAYPNRFYVGSIYPDPADLNAGQSIVDTDYLPQALFWQDKNCPVHTRFVNGRYTLNLTIVDRTAPSNVRLAMVYELNNGKYGICRKGFNTATPTNYVWDPQEGKDTVDVINEIDGNNTISYTEFKNLGYQLELVNDNSKNSRFPAYNRTGFYNFPVGAYPCIYPRGAGFNRTHQNRFREIQIPHLLTPTFARENFVENSADFTFNFKLYHPGTKQYYGNGSVTLGPGQIPLQGFVDILGASRSEYFMSTYDNYPLIPF
jgi:hypothetical protein